MDLKPTTIKDALANWQEKNNQPLAEAKSVGLQFRYPPIAKMDNNLSVLKNCEKLYLSTNMIEKISGVSALQNLKVLALGRNHISSFVGLDSLADTLEELWISYNNIEKFKGLANMRKLRVLYMAHNRVDSWNEVQKLADIESLQELDLLGNPIYENMEDGEWRKECTKRLVKLSILNGVPVIKD